MVCGPERPVWSTKKTAATPRGRRVSWPGSRNRPVVLLTICLADKFREESFTLANRAHLNYVVLIGRTVLSRRFLVVPARKYTHKPDCIGR